jgi:tetratricopeptide (TPR) repeat protein
MAARCLLRSEDSAGAVAEFEAAGNIPAARYELARLHFREGRIREAQVLVEPLLREFPDAIQPAALRHRIAHQQSDRRNAFFHADRSNRATRRLPNPFDADATRLIDAHGRLGLHGRWKEGESLLRAGKYADAEKLLRESLAVGWRSAGADLLAEVALDLERGEEALALLQDIVARDGPSAHNLGRLGDAFAETGRAADARDAWQHSAALGNLVESKDTLYRLAESHQKAGNAASHEQHLGRALLGAGIERLRAGAIADARFLFDESVRMSPKNPGAWFYLGECARVSGRLDDARRAYGECLAVDPYYGRAIEAMELLDADR